MSFLSLFCTSAVLKFSLVNIIGGFLFGIGIGFVPTYSTFMEISMNCTLYKSEASCSTALHATCLWSSRGSSGDCFFSGLNCGQFNGSESLCEANGNHDSTCVFDHQAKMCKNRAGYTALQSGIFAGAMIVGVLVGCAVGGNVVQHLRTKQTMLLMSAVALLGSLLVHASAWKNIYSLLIAGRVMFGIACGLGCVCCPMYTDLYAPSDLRSRIGSLFQVSITLAIAVIAGLGLLLNPTNFEGQDVNMQLRFQLYLLLVTASSMCVALVAVFVDDSPNLDKAGRMLLSGHRLLNDQASSTGQKDDPLDERCTNVEAFTIAEMRVPLLSGFFMACAAQMTGINAIMNYAPSITANMKLEPLTGNFLIMFWNFVTTLVAIPIAAKVSMRRMFLTGTILISVACLCMGIPVYPGVTTTSMRDTLSIVGVVSVIAAFEVGIGPPFWVLTQEIFPVSFRSRGTSITTVVLQVFNIIINVCFPLSVQGLSGGPNGDQNKGMAITFIIFGSIGIACWIVLLKILVPYDERV